jgi:hypothetical protein
LRAEAQRAIDRWGNQMLELAISQATTDKAQAIVIAQQIPSISAAYDKAQQQIQFWQPSPRNLVPQR